MRNLYKVLGIASSADDGSVKSAFRVRAKKVHPDVNPGNKRAEARFIELVEAYEVLRHAETRASYDAYLTERRRESWRRLFHCAGLMTASFSATTASALLAMSLAGADVPLRESWQLALAALSPMQGAAPSMAAHAGTAWEGGPQVAAWRTQVVSAAEDTAIRKDTAPPSTAAAPSGSTPSPAGAKPVRQASAEAPALRAAEPTHGGQAAATASPKEPRRMASARSKPAGQRRAQPQPIPVQPPHVGQDAWWPWQAAEEQAYYGLGAKGL